MPDFIDRYIFNPNSLSIVEFLANYFISLLATVMPFFLLIAIVLGIFTWMSQGFDKQGLIEKFVQISLALSLTSLLLFTTGRKVIQLDSTTTTQSYLIIDTLNDFLVLGNRLGDALVYNMLFGFNYTGSDQPLFEFDDKNIFQLKNYNLTPTGEDYVDGFFISNLLNLVNKNIKKNYITSSFLKTKIIRKYNTDLKVLNNVDNKIKSFIKTKDFLKSEKFFKEKSYFDQLLQNNIKTAIQKKQITNLKLNLKNIDENSKLTPLEYFNVYNDTVKNIPFNYQHDFYNLNIKLTNPTTNKITITKFIYDFPSRHPTRYDVIKNDYKIDNDLLIEKDILKDEIKQILNKDSQLNGIKTINNFINDNNSEIKSFNINDIINNLKDYNYLTKEMKRFFKNNSKYNNYEKLLNKNYFTLSEAKDYINLYFSFIKYKETVLIGKMFNPKSGYEYTNKDYTTKDVLFNNRLHLLLDSLTNLYNKNNITNDVNDLGLTVGVKANTIFKIKLNDSSELSSEQIKKILLRVNKDNYSANYGIGANFLKKDNNGFFKLKYLSNDFLLKNEINNLLFYDEQKDNKLLNLDIGFNMDKYKQPDKTSFHWYNLNQYAIGLKNLFLQNNSFYSNMGVYQDTVTANTLLATCLPVYQQISNNQITIDKLSDDKRGLCFPKKSTMNSTTSIIAKIYGWYKGIMIGTKTSLFLNKWVMIGSGPLKLILSMMVGIAVGTIAGYVYFVLLYTMLIYLFFLIPTVFIFVAVISWIIRASMALIFFGFSIILFLFTQKKDRLIENFYTFSMYVLMPLFLSFIFFLIIHLSFVMSITINNLIPDIGAVNYALGNNANEIITKVMDNPDIINHGYFAKISNFLTSTGDKIYQLKENGLKIMVVGAYNLIIEVIKFIIILIIEISLYMKLWKIDQFINEIISTNVKSAELSPERMIHMFGGTKAGNFVRMLS